MLNSDLLLKSNFLFVCYITFLNVASWSDSHVQLIINDVTHRTVFTEANMATATAGEVTGSLILAAFTLQAKIRFLARWLLWSLNSHKSHEIFSNHIWTDVSESEQLQTLNSDLTVRDVSLRLYATSLYATPDPRLFELLLLADITGATEDVENISPWTEHKTKFLIFGEMAPFKRS